MIDAYELPEEDCGAPPEVDPIYPTPDVEDQVDRIFGDLLTGRSPGLSWTRRVLGRLTFWRRRPAARPDWVTAFADEDLVVVTGEHYRSLILDRDSARAAASWHRLERRIQADADQSDRVADTNVEGVAA